MFQHMFATMHELLDGIIEQYPKAEQQQKAKYDDQLQELKKLSDTFVEQWIDFEEKLSLFKEHCGAVQPSPCSVGASPAESFQAEPVQAASCSYADMLVPDEVADLFCKGQGYYKLFMFSESAACFEQVISLAPECNTARLHLGMSYMHLRDWNEAQRHFQLLVVLSDFPKWVALGYNALGCIQAIRMNLAFAEQLFRKAYDVCPSFTDSLSNLRSCQETPGQLSLYFGSTELICT